METKIWRFDTAESGQGVPMHFSELAKAKKIIISVINVGLFTV